MRDSELIDDSNTEPCLDQRATVRAEPRTDGHIVVELLASKDFGHDPPVWIGRVNANKR